MTKRNLLPGLSSIAAAGLISLASQPAAAKERLAFSPDDGVTYRGVGWAASFGLNAAVDSGERMDGGPASRNDSDLVIRRLRPSMSLSLSPQWSARIEYEFGDIGPGFKNAWVQWRPMSRLSIRAGSQFAPFGLENSMSSRNMPWSERSLTTALTAAALAGVSARWHDDRWTLSGGVYGNDVSDDDRRQFAGRSAIVRGTWVPLRDDGWLWHVGASGEYRRGERGTELRLRSRPETALTDTRLVDTGAITGVDSLQTFGLETALRRGPLLLTLEHLQASTSSATSPSATFSGQYVSAAWFITGERRSYSEATGTFGGARPRRDWGALEVAARVGRLDLDDGAVQGGEQRSTALYLNWYYDTYGRVSLGYVRSEAERLGVDSEREFLTLRAQIEF